MPALSNTIPYVNLIGMVRALSILQLIAVAVIIVKYLIDRRLATTLTRIPDPGTMDSKRPLQSVLSPSCSISRSETLCLHSHPTCLRHSYWECAHVRFQVTCQVWRCSSHLAGRAQLHQSAGMVSDFYVSITMRPKPVLICEQA
jgi:hypothetical protein